MSPQASADLVGALETGQRDFEAACEGLSDSDALRKPAPDRWSAIDCIDHLCVTESLGLERLQGAQAAPEAQLDSARERKLAAQVVDRGVKIQGPPVAMPTGRFRTLADALAEFAATRARTIEFVKGCPNLAALRLTHPVFGPLSGREYVVLIAGHPARHAAQIGEIRSFFDAEAQRYGDKR
jgi:hypothetical protein